MPATRYEWVDAQNFWSRRASKDAWNLVPVSAEKDGSFNVLSPSLGNLAQQVVDALKSIDWNPAEQTHRLQVDGYPVLVVVKSSVKANPLQVARQLGVDAVAALVKSAAMGINVQKMDGDLGVADVCEGIFMASIIRMHSNQEEDCLRAGFDPSGPQAEVEKRRKMARALTFTKWLQDAPSNFLNSVQFAEIAEEYFGKNAKVTVLGREEMTPKAMAL